MSPQLSHALLTAALLALIAWRLYGRIRRYVGRQRFTARRPWTLVVLYPLLVVMLVLALLPRPLAEGCLLGGLLVGVALGLLGLRLTRFETTAEGLFYTPSAHLGVALSTLLVCRIIYRFVVHGMPENGLATAAAGFTPLTMLLIGTLAGYYVTYAAGLLRRSFRSRSTPASEVSSIETRGVTNK